jgi:hypothetical protein
MIAATIPPEIGYVPNGAKCGEGKVCQNYKCIAVGSLRSECVDCNGHGVCNSKGNCHCDKGWAPPSCDEPGNGGSIDSHFELSGKCEKTG